MSHAQFQYWQLRVWVLSKWKISGSGIQKRTVLEMGASTGNGNASSSTGKLRVWALTDGLYTYIPTIFVIMVTLRSVLVAILASTPSFTHAFTSHNTQQQQHVMVMINIIEGEPTSRHHQALSSSSSPEDGTSSSATSPPSRRSFLFSAAAVMAGGSSWQCRPLLAEAAPTDCFQDCLKNCKLIAPKVSSHLGNVSHLSSSNLSS